MSFRFHRQPALVRSAHRSPSRAIVVSCLLTALGAAACTPARRVDSGVEPRDAGLTDSSIDAGADREPVDGFPPDDAPPITRMDDLHLYLSLGDSQAAGFNASAVTEFPAYFHCQARPADCARYGWPGQLFENRSWPDYDNSAYDGHDILTLFPAAQMYDQARSGWTSDDVVERLRETLAGLPAPNDGEDTLVTLGVGGNDFNDHLDTMFCRTCEPGCVLDDLSLSCHRTFATEAVAAQLRSNFDEIFGLLKSRFENRDRGQALTVIATNVYDPTDRQGTIPARFGTGFCATLRYLDNLSDELRARAITDLFDNFHFFNAELRAAVEANGGILADHDAIFQGHGMNSPDADRWMDVDCTHPNDAGHDHIRRLIFERLTGDSF